MKKISKIATSAGLLVLMGVGFNAFASPTGAYVDAMGGASYITNSKLSNLGINPANGLTNPEFQKSGIGYTGRGAVGYFFNQDPLNSWAYGLEAGYNYFSPIKSNRKDAYYDGIQTINEQGSVTTNAWAGDLDFIVSEDITKSISLLYKLGVGYESISQKYTTPGVAGTGITAETKTLEKSGFGLAGGLGIQYNFNKNFAFRAELDGMKGGEGIGYGQVLGGLVWSF